MDYNPIAYKVGELMKDDLIDHLLNEISKDIALEIVESFPEEMKKREELYMLNKAVKRLKMKLQEYTNYYEIQEN